MPTPDPNEPAAPADERTIGQILGLAEAAPMPAPGFAAMADTVDELVDPTAAGKPKPPAPPPPTTPEPPPPAAVTAEQYTPPSEIAALNDQRRRIYEEQRGRYGAIAERKAITPSDADITRGNVRYESRIQIVDAWQYPGRLSPATPDWIDRNWVGYADDDPIRQIAAGPCLRVPSSADPAEVVLARIGDYVCRQQVLTDDGGPKVIRTEVWAAEQFQRLFVAVSPPADARVQPPAEPAAIVEAVPVPARPKAKSTRQRSRAKPAASRSAA
jgi:hypothetical protein